VIVGDQDADGPAAVGREHSLDQSTPTRQT
jgi:hypothetical protein